MECLELLTQRGVPAMEPTAEATAAYNQRIDDMMQSLIWSHPKARSYYKNSKGRVFLSCPYRLVEYWQMTRQPNLDDYRFHDTLAAGVAMDDAGLAVRGGAPL
jgi:4-hydroxyacetophenone monooxygenase